MPQSFRSRKKQTRLQFSAHTVALEAKENYSQAVQDRLANVRYASANLRGAFSVETPGKGLTSESRSVALDSTTTSPLSTPPTSPSRSSPATPVTPASKIQTLIEDDEDEDDDELPLPSLKRRKFAATIERSTIASSPRRSTRLSRSSPIRKVDSSHSRRLMRRSHKTQTTEEHTRDASGLILPEIASGRAETQTGAISRLSDLGDAESSDSEADVLVSQPSLRRRTKAQKVEDDAFIVDDDHDAGDEPVAKARSIRHSQQQPALRSRHNLDDFMVGDDEVEYETSDAAKRSDIHRTSSKRDAEKMRRKRARKEQEELEQDLNDLQDTDQDEDVIASRTRGGPVTTQRDQLKQHLALLKRKRAGKHISRILDSEDEGSGDVRSQSDQDVANVYNANLEPDEIDVISIDSQSRSFIGAPEPHPEAYDDQEGDDFIVEDAQPSSSHRHGRPHPDIPLEFTSFASAKPKDLFIHIIEWMVKNKISPAFARNDELFNLSFSRLDDQVKAQAGSRLISSAWNATFKHAILARPVMTVEALPGLDEDHMRTCDACNRTNHPARYDFKFSGNPYHKDTLEPLELDKEEDDNDNESGDNNNSPDSEEKSRPNKSASDDDASDAQSSSSSRSSNQSYDSQGHSLPRQNQHFYLGRYCAAAAEMGHKLTHWKHHLNTNVLSYLEDQTVLDATEIIRRDKFSHRRREREAEKVVDAMADTGVVRELWERFQADLDDARLGMEGHELRSRSSHGGHARARERISNVRLGGGGGVKTSGIADARIGEWFLHNKGTTRRSQDDSSDSD